jgi:deoxycytidylate deaminase
MVTIPDSVKREVKRRMIIAMVYDVHKMCGKHPLTAVIWVPKKEDYITGWNGPPTRALHLYPGCQSDETCLRSGLESGVDMHICPTHHAERKAIDCAARKGPAIENGILFMDSWFPCKECAKSITESGLIALVTPDDPYENRAERILNSELRKEKYDKPGSYQFKTAERLIVGAGIKIIVDPDIRPH